MNLTAMMKAKKINVKELAEKVDVTPRRIEGWKYGEGEPDIQHLIALADALGCTVDALIRDGKGGEETS